MFSVNESTNRAHSLIFSPMSILFYAILGVVAGVWGHLYGASLFIGLAVIAVLGRVELHHRELRAEIAALRAELAATPLPADQAPDRE